MSVFKIYASNPKDGTSYFDKVRFYEADDDIGTNEALIGESDIDLTTVDLEDFGFTFLLYSGGDSDKYYATSYFNSDTLVETDKTGWIKGDRNRLGFKFLELMGDTENEVFESEVVSQFSEYALEAMYPELQREFIDTSLAIEKGATTETLEYNVPVGISNIMEVGVGDVNDRSNFKVLRPFFWKLEGGKLHFLSLSGLDDGETLRLVCLRKYNDIGEVPERYDHLLLYHMQMSAYDWMASRYPRFERFSQLQQGSRVSFENLRVTAREFERKFEDGKLSLAKEGGEVEYA